MSALPIILTRALLYALAVVQCWLAWSFWQSYAGEGEVKWLLPVFGVALALIEVFALVVAAQADAQGRKSRALLWRGVWIVLFVVNFGAEIGAFANVIAVEEERRGVEIAQAQSLTAERDEQVALISSLTTELQTRRADKPIEALEVELEAARALARSFSPARPRDARDIARLESALITARAREEARAERDRLDAAISAMGAPASAHHPQLVTLAQLLSRAGINATASDVAAFIPLGLAVVIKLVLTFGFWVTTTDAATAPIEIREPVPAPRAPERPAQAVTDAQPKPKRRRKRDLAKPVLAGDGEPWVFLLDDPTTDGKTH